MTWQPIESAPPHMSHNEIVVARIWQPTNDDGEPSGEPQIAWAHVAYFSHAGWMAGTGGFKGVHGFASFPLGDATHFMLLPQSPTQHRERGE